MALSFPILMSGPIHSTCQQARGIEHYRDHGLLLLLQLTSICRQKSLPCNHLSMTRWMPAPFRQTFHTCSTGHGVSKSSLNLYHLHANVPRDKHMMCSGSVQSEQRPWRFAPTFCTRSAFNSFFSKLRICSASRSDSLLVAAMDFALSTEPLLASATQYMWHERVCLRLLTTCAHQRVCKFISASSAAQAISRASGGCRATQQPVDEGTQQLVWACSTASAAANNATMVSSTQVDLLCTAWE